MADKKTTEETEVTSWSSGDIIDLVIDPGGTPLDRKIKLNNLFKLPPVTKTDDYVITVSDLPQSFRMNAVTAKTFTLPSVGASEDGIWGEFLKQGAGRMTLQAVDSDFIDDSSAAGTIYTETLYGNITLKYIHGMLRWVIMTALGQFITT